MQLSINKAKNRHSVLILRLQQCRDQTLISADIIPVHIEMTIYRLCHFTNLLLETCSKLLWRRTDARTNKNVKQTGEKTGIGNSPSHFARQQWCRPRIGAVQLFFLILIFYFLIFILPQHKKTHRHCQTLKYRRLKMLWPPRQYWHWRHYFIY